MKHTREALGSALPTERPFLPTRRTASTGLRQASRFQVVRTSLGIKLGQGSWPFSRGDLLEGLRVAHPVNAARKVVIDTQQGTFNINEEDLEEV